MLPKRSVRRGPPWRGPLMKHPRRKDPLAFVRARHLPRDPLVLSRSPSRTGSIPPRRRPPLGGRSPRVDAERRPSVPLASRRARPCPPDASDESSFAARPTRSRALPPAVTSAGSVWCLPSPRVRPRARRASSRIGVAVAASLPVCEPAKPNVSHRATSLSASRSLALARRAPPLHTHYDLAADSLRESAVVVPTERAPRTLRPLRPARIIYLPRTTSTSSTRPWRTSSAARVGALYHGLLGKERIGFPRPPRCGTSHPVAFGDEVKITARCEGRPLERPFLTPVYRPSDGKQVVSPGDDRLHRPSMPFHSVPARAPPRAAFSSARRRPRRPHAAERKKLARRASGSA